ncbi:MAG: VOC family protein [Betaproteobacteria bacterium]|nr:MAG: VOC family protein [Betaproteobacteria bacterium]
MNTPDRQRPPPGALFLDHVSHFVPDLDAAARALEELGFVVTAESEQQTPEGRVGASNRCVMLEEGYIELLTPTHDTPATRRIRESIARFAGVHLACFGTPDAEGEHRRLGAHGFAPRPLVDLRRRLGRKQVRFKVARPAAERMPEGRIQFVEQLTPEAIWSEKNLAHRNGVTGLKALYVVADDVADAAARWAEFTGMLPRRDGELVCLEARRGRVYIGSTPALRKLFGDVPPAPALAGYALSVAAPERFAARCAESGLPVKERDGRHAVSLPATLGGAWLLEG